MVGIAVKAWNIKCEHRRVRMQGASLPGDNEGAIK
jgi:hypothetical protein